MNYVSEILELIECNEPEYDVIVDVRVAGVVVPEGLDTNDGTVTFAFGFGLARPPSPTFYTDFLKATLSFGGRPFDCTFPWESVRHIAYGEGKKSYIVFVSPVHPSRRPKPEGDGKPKLRLV